MGQSRERTSRSSTLKNVLKRAGLFDLARMAKGTLEGAGLIKKAVVDSYKIKDPDIVWERTLAYMPSTACFGSGAADIFLSPNLDAQYILELAEDLKRQVDPLTGQSLIDAVFTTEVFGNGPYAPREPHLLLLPNDGITFRNSVGNKRLWGDATMANAPGKKSGVHQKDGVLYAYGSGFKRGFKAPNADVYDLVPTVLHSMGLPLPIAFDGRVLEELFAKDERVEQTSEVPDRSSEGGMARRKLKKLLEV